MKRIFALIAIIVIALGITVLRQRMPSQPVSNDVDIIIRARVTEFGTHLKNVSLLSPEVRSQIASEYASFLTPELLLKWQKDTSQALGRSTSSPWPERINIQNVTRVTDTTYSAEGVVVEVTSAEHNGEVAATYPLTLTLEKQGDAWLISEVSKGAYSEIPHRSEVVGVWECLPHINTNGPQTLECAFGIKTDTGLHYAVNTSLLETYPVDFPAGTRVKAEGVLVPADQLSSNTWQKYPIEGIISVTSIQKI